jgi:hypothetical protein
MAGVLQEAEIPHSSGAPESTPGFLMGSMLLICFLVLSVVCIVLVLNSRFLDIFYQRLVSDSIIQKYFSNILLVFLDLT